MGYIITCHELKTFNSRIVTRLTYLTNHIGLIENVNSRCTLAKPVIYYCFLLTTNAECTASDDAMLCVVPRCAGPECFRYRVQDDILLRHSYSQWYVFSVSDPVSASTLWDTVPN